MPNAGAINSSQEQYDLSDDGESDSSEESTESARPDEFDLDEEETTYYRTSLRQSDLFMNMQGFSTCVSSGHAQTEITTFLHDKAALVEYKGKTYYQGRVYEYQHHIGKDHLVGIHSFAKTWQNALKWQNLKTRLLGWLQKRLKTRSV